jgi:hypothetical protein
VTVDEVGLENAEMRDEMEAEKVLGVEGVVAIEMIAGFVVEADFESVGIARIGFAGTADLNSALEMSGSDFVVQIVDLCFGAEIGGFEFVAGIVDVAIVAGTVGSDSALETADPE